MSIDPVLTSNTTSPMESRRSRTPVIATVFGMTCVAILAAVFLGAGTGDSQPKPLQSITPSQSPSLDSDVNGWPTTGRNPPGFYALDGDRCGSTRAGSCNTGWMHNGYGSGDIDIFIHESPQWVTPEVDPGGGDTENEMAVVVAGHDGVYRRIAAAHEEWAVQLEATTFVIELKAKSGASQADLAEAHAIIDSMRTGPAVSTTNDLGFSLMFTITTNDWDSG